MSATTIVAVAGVPAMLGANFARYRAEIIEEGSRRVEWRPTRSGTKYTEEYARGLYASLHQTLTTLVSDVLLQDRARQVGAVVTYFRHDGWDPAALFKVFGVEMLIVPVEPPELPKGSLSPNKKSQIARSMAERVREATLYAEQILQVIGDEVTSGDNRTPLLLPPQNFGAAEVTAVLDQIHEAVTAERTSEEIRGLLKSLRGEVDRVPIDGSRGRHFVSSRGVAFVCPGPNRHGYFHLSSQSDHDAVCMVRSRLRIGASFDPRFHYDCISVKGPLPAKWQSCHRQDVRTPRGRDHVNIAPNDFVR